MRMRPICGETVAFVSLGVVAIAGGTWHSLAVKADGENGDVHQFPGNAA